jgi:transcriptional regulator GlxA family with amidase domain
MLVVRLTRKTPAKTTARESPSNWLASNHKEFFMARKIDQILSIMRARLGEKTTASSMARAAGLSRSRLYDLFRNETGTSPARYAKQLRLERARDLLETGTLSVKEIAGVVGFTDVSHFVRNFKMAYGASPSEFRATKSRERSGSDS